jgi:hypothetical protein
MVRKLKVRRSGLLRVSATLQKEKKKADADAVALARLSFRSVSIITSSIFLLLTEKEHGKELDLPVITKLEIEYLRMRNGKHSESDRKTT